jgi:uncharacterized repeat protein (TIGR03803 family)
MEAMTMKSLLALLCLCIVSPAQTFTTLANFPEAYSPTGLLTEGSDGNFYAITVGVFITPVGMFKLTPGGTLTELFDFGSGYKGTGIVQGGDGNFYTALNGGSGGSPVYRVTPAGTASVIHMFPSDGSEGFFPNPLILGSDGNLHGTNGQGGAPDGAGTIFKLTLSGTITILDDFSLVGPGGGPGPLVQGSDGNFYMIGGSGGSQPGALFQITPSGTITNLHTFTDDEGPPVFTLTKGSDGALYGITQNGGANGGGIFYKITTSGTFTMISSFAAGLGISAGLAQAPDGNFYGTTYSGSADIYGTVFQLTLTGTLTTIHSFSLAEG